MELGMELDYESEMEFVLSFECERCHAPVLAKDEGEEKYKCHYDWIFCGNCGACYARYRSGHIPPSYPTRIRRIKYGQMYLPPLEWNEIFRQGMEHGLADGKRTEALNRRSRPFWRRLWIAIRNR